MIRIMTVVITLLLVLVAGGIINDARATIDQKLSIVKDDKTVGGQFSIVIEVKGTGLTSAHTLGSATIDVQFDITRLTYADASKWAFGATDGYNRSANNNGGFIRIAITGGGVNENNDGTPKGYDIGTSYAAWVQLNFSIVVAEPNVLTIDSVSNAVSLFTNPGNNPNDGVINPQPLSPPINIIGTSLNVAQRLGIPAEFALDQNYPNPFNPSTSIDFALPRQEQVTLDVFNVLGQKVATLVKGTLPPGYYTERFEGAGMASGIYFYRMNAGQLTFLKKMLMIK
jgi:hypothetical protein